MHWGGRPWRQPSRPGCTAHGDGRAAGDVALAAGQGPVPHRREASPRVAQNGAHAAPRSPPSLLPRSRGGSPLRPPGRLLAASPRGAQTPDPWSPALSAHAEPSEPRAPRPGCAAAASAGRADGAGTVGGGRAAAGLGLGRRKPQRQQSPGGDDGEGESRTPSRPDLDLRPRSLLRGPETPLSLPAPHTLP